MDDISWGLYMVVAGMGTVFLLLLFLMLLLTGIARVDRSGPRTRRAPSAPVPVDDAPSVEPQYPGGLSPELIAAVSIAVLTHAKVRRGQAAPAMRRVAPGSQLFASRWVSVGRAYQNQPWK